MQLPGGAVVGKLVEIFATGSSTLAFLLTNSQVANADEGSLFDQFGTDPKKITQREDPAKSRVAVVAQPKTESAVAPNLRSNYYYPTNKKRYLPRIKKCNDAIPGAAEAIGNGDWAGQGGRLGRCRQEKVMFGEFA